MKKVKARKVYNCCVCKRVINIGDYYSRVNIKGIEVYHFCSKHNKPEINNHISKSINDYFDSDYDYYLWDNGYSSNGL